MSEKPSAKRTNSEIVKALIIITQDFYTNHDPKAASYEITIDESNLVTRISQAMAAYRRQRDRMTDLLDNMKKIVSGD